MNKTRIFVIAALIAAIYLLMGISACQPSGNGKDDVDPTTPTVVDDGKGVGEEKDIELTEPLNEEMIAQGKEIFELKCSACHQLTDKRVVGPGLEGVTNRRKPEWIMNMITNPEKMIKEDPTAKALYEEYLTPMVNQNISVDEARAILEFFRKNDEEKTGKRDEGGY